MADLTYFQAAVLGFVQGVTEFLPVSSSGHLVITQEMLGLPGDSPAMLLFDVVAHFGTLLAVFVVFSGTFLRFARRLAAELRPGFAGRRTAVMVACLGMIACVPTAVIGLAFKDEFESAFDSMGSTGFGLLVTGALLFAVGRLPRPRRGWRRIGWWRAGLVGLAQGCAILPGISRSGSTICTAMMLGIKRRWAAEFSFLIAVPPIVGAGLIKLKDTFDLPAEQLGTIIWGPTLAGATVSFVSGAIALRVLMGLVVRDKIQYFAYYCWPLGVTVLLWSFLAA